MTSQPEHDDTRHGRDGPGIERLFAEALEDPRGPEAFVGRLARTDPETAFRLDRLVAADRSAPGWLGTSAGLEHVAADLFAPSDPAADTAGTRSTDDPSPPDGADDVETLASARRIPGFAIVRWLGRGASGTVFEAEQLRPRRRVAVKILHAAGDEDAVRRFDVEADALASLDHPAIARIFGAGHVRDARGRTRPWLAMELVDGAAPLDAYAARACVRADGSIDVRARIQLFLRVADGVRHAHAKGIIHRDLKPANVLVDRTGSPRIIDFGVALVAPAAGKGGARGGSAAEFDAADRALCGTLKTMSPEQCDGRRVDVRTDVYALGVVLFELLVGSPPYRLEGRSLLGVLDAIRRQPPEFPEPAGRSRGARGDSRALPSDLRAVLTCALEKDPDRRYGTVAEFASDLRRHVAYEPVAARPASPWHRFALFARRRRALCIGASVAVIASVAAVALIVTLWIHATDALERMRAAERARAELQTVSQELAEISNETVAETRASIRSLPEESARSRRALVRRAHERLQRLRGALEGTATARLPLARAFLDLADLHGQSWLAAPRDAEVAFEASRTAVRLLSPDAAGTTDAPAGPAHARTLHEARITFVHAARKVDREGEAADAADAMVDAARARWLRADDPASAHAARARLVDALQARSDLYIAFGNEARPLADIREAHRIAETGFTAERSSRAATAVAWTAFRRGIWEGRVEGDHAQAIRLARRSLEAQLEALALGGLDDPIQASTDLLRFMASELVARQRAEAAGSRTALGDTSADRETLNRRRRELLEEFDQQVPSRRHRAALLEPWLVLATVGLDAERDSAPWERVRSRVAEAAEHAAHVRGVVAVAERLERLGLADDPAAAPLIRRAVARLERVADRTPDQDGVLETLRRALDGSDGGR